MSIVTANLAVSLDGFAAGSGQSLDHPVGTGADALTAWMFETDQPGREANRDLLAALHARTGAHGVMLGEDSGGVLDRHLPPRKGDHLGAQTSVRLEQSGSFKRRGYCHVCPLRA